MKITFVKRTSHSRRYSWISQSKCVHGSTYAFFTHYDQSGPFRTEKGYISNVGDKDFLDITFTVQNRKEKAYQAALYLTYDPEELELPTIVG